MEIIILTLSCMGFCALAVLGVGLVDMLLEKRERQRYNRWCYSKKVVARIK